MAALGSSARRPSPSPGACRSGRHHRHHRGRGGRRARARTGFGLHYRGGRRRDSQRSQPHAAQRGHAPVDGAHGSSRSRRAHRQRRRRSVRGIGRERDGDARRHGRWLLRQPRGRNRPQDGRGHHHARRAARRRVHQRRARGGHGGRPPTRQRRLGADQRWTLRSGHRRHAPLLGQLDVPAGLHARRRVRRDRRRDRRVDWRRRGGRGHSIRQRCAHLRRWGAPGRRWKHHPPGALTWRAASCRGPGWTRVGS